MGGLQHNHSPRNIFSSTVSLAIYRGFVCHDNAWEAEHLSGGLWGSYAYTYVLTLRLPGNRFKQEIRTSVERAHQEVQELQARNSAIGGKASHYHVESQYPDIMSQDIWTAGSGSEQSDGQHSRNAEIIVHHPAHDPQCQRPIGHKSIVTVHQSEIILNTASAGQREQRIAEATQEGMA